MTNHELFAQAAGLKQTAQNMIETGNGTTAALSIARQAAENLLALAKRLDGIHSPISAIEVRPGVAWREIHAIAGTICRFCEEQK